MALPAPARIGVDIGGTFTDFALEHAGRRVTAKVLTTPDAPERAVMEGLAEVLAAARISPGDVGLVIHGTTLATNALIERKGAKTALVTTEGFRDVIEIRGEDRYEQYDLSIEFPPPLVPRRLRLPVPERIDSQGRVRRPLDLGAVRALVPVLRAEGVEAVAVGFLHSYANPVHEQQAGAILAEGLPGISVTLSAEVSPEMREYERLSTACANAYVQPRMTGYLARLQSGLADAGFRCPLLLMTSAGGITTVETASRFPVRLVESGPAGGAIFSSHIASEAGWDEVLSFDMGGTTAKICLIDGGAAQTSRSFEVARIYRFRKGSGLPMRIPVIEMVEIGAGGGSIARIDAMQRIAVGPDSAGSVPGPACYGRGGPEPTVTDADLVLGRIDPVGFSGGRMQLDQPAAEAALAGAIGGPLGLSPVLAAFGIGEMVDENMANAARVHAIESGKDVTRRTLIAFGGAAPLHAARVAEKLGIATYVIPAGAGVGSAVGFLRAPVAYEVVRSAYQRLDEFDLGRANAVLAEMAATARAVVEPATFGTPLEENRLAFMRYVGQGHEIAVPVPARSLDIADVGALTAAFEAEYSKLYSRVVPGMSVELLTWAVRVAAAVDSFVETAREMRPSRPPPVGERRLFDPGSGETLTVPVWDRTKLEPGAVVAGPAVILEDETTTIVTAMFQATIDGHGRIVCRRIEI